MRDKRTPKNVCGEANIFVAVAIVLIKLISIDKLVSWYLSISEEKMWLKSCGFSWTFKKMVSLSAR